MILDRFSSLLRLTSTLSVRQNFDGNIQDRRCSSSRALKRSLKLANFGSPAYQGIKSVVSLECLQAGQIHSTPNAATSMPRKISSTAALWRLPRWWLTAIIIALHVATMCMGRSPGYCVRSLLPSGWSLMVCCQR